MYVVNNYDNSSEMVWIWNEFYPWYNSFWFEICKFLIFCFPLPRNAITKPTKMFIRLEVLWFTTHTRFSTEKVQISKNFTAFTFFMDLTFCQLICQPSLSVQMHKKQMISHWLIIISLPFLFDLNWGDVTTFPTKYILGNK